MKHYLVEWINYSGEYRSAIVYAESKASACRLIKQAYTMSRKHKARELNG